MQTSFLRFSGFALAAIATVLSVGDARAETGRRCLDGTIPPMDEDCPDLNGDGLSNRDDEIHDNQICFGVIPACIERVEQEKQDCFRRGEDEYQICLDHIHEIAQYRCADWAPSTDALDDNGFRSIAYWLCIKYQERQIGPSVKDIGFDVGNNSRATCGQIRDTTQLQCFDKFYEARQYECVDVVPCTRN